MLLRITILLKLLCLVRWLQLVSSWTIKLNWFAPFRSGGGYCSEAISFVFAFDSIICDNISLLIHHHGDSNNIQFLQSQTEREAAVLEKYRHDSQNKIFDLVINVCHSEPGAWSAPIPRYHTTSCPPQRTLGSGSEAAAVYNIGRTMFETDRLPSGWMDRLNYMNEVWVPTDFAQNIFQASGMSTPIRVVAEPVDTDFYRVYNKNDYDQLHAVPPEILALVDVRRRGTKLLLFVGKFEGRKGIALLLCAFLREFLEQHDSDSFQTQLNSDVLLVLVTSAYHSSNDFDHQVVEILSAEGWNVEQIRAVAPFRILSNVHQTHMPMLYNLATALVIPSHGEGWGRPHMEAMACGTPVIATNWSGPAAFVTEANGYPLRIKETLVKTPGWSGHLWAQPEESHLRALMRRVVERPAEAETKGLQARADMEERYSLQVMGRVVEGEVQRIAAHVLKNRMTENDHDFEL